MLKPVDALFRRNGIRCCYDIDDSLIMNQDFEKCTTETAFVASEMDKLGFTENIKKSVFQPTQRNVFFFGLVIDTIEFKVFLTEEKIVKILSLCSSIPKEKKVTIRKFASLIGLVVHAFNTFMHYRNLEKDKIKNLNNSDNYDLEMYISNASTTEMIWWSHNVRTLNGKPIPSFG